MTERITFLPLTTPGESASTINPLRALCDGVASSAVLANTKYQCATPPFVIHIFWPFNMYSSPLRTAFVRILATSDPAPGSVTQYACTMYMFSETERKQVGRRTAKLCVTLIVSRCDGWHARQCWTMPCITLLISWCRCGLVYFMLHAAKQECRGGIPVGSKNWGLLT